MTIIPSSQNWRVGIALTSLVLGGCGPQSGTETDNPLHDERTDPPPPYESPSRFNPDEPGAPGCEGLIDDTPPERGPYWTAIATQLFGVDQHRGLLALDGSDPLALEPASVTELRGYAHAVISTGSGVAVVFDESPELPQDAIATPDQLTPQLTLAYFDTSNPSALERRASVVLEGESFGLSVHDGAVWAVTTLPQEHEPSCQLPWTRCDFPSRVEMLVSGYRFDADGAQLVDSARLPMSQRAWLGQAGFVSVTSEDVDDPGAPGTLEWLRLDGSMLVSGDLPVDAAPAFNTPVDLVGEHLYYFTEQEGGGSLTLHVVDIGGSTPQPIATLRDLPRPGPVGSFFGETWAIIGSEDFTRAAVVVQLDGDGPTVTPLPEGFSMALPLRATDATDAPANPTLPRLLAWGDIDGTGTLTLGLIDGTTGLASGHSDASLPTSLPATGSVREDDPLYPPQTVQDEQRVAFPYLTDDDRAQRAPALGIVEISETSLEFAMHQVDALDDQVIALGGAFLAPSGLGIAAVGEDDKTAWFDFGARNVEDVMPIPQGYATLEWTWGGHTQVVVHDPDGMELGSVEVPGGARRLVSVADHVGVLVEPQGNECEQAQGYQCDERSFLIIDPGSSPELSGRVDLPALPPAGDGQWQPPGELVRLDSGDWVFASQATESCSFITDCEARGIAYRSLSEANINVAGTAETCPPDTEDCPEAALPARAPEVYGRRTRLTLYRLDASDVSQPRWITLGSSELELFDSQFAPLRASGNTLLVTRMEVQLERGQSFFNVPARFMLDSFDASSGQANATAADASPVNIPGYAIAMAAAPADKAGESVEPSIPILYSVEPGVTSDVAATLHRLRLEQDGAHIEASQPLTGRYGDMQVVGDHAHYLRKGVDGCGSGALQVIALDETLSMLAEVPLPGTEWELMDWSSDRLLLRGPDYQGYALFDVNDPEPALVGFFTQRVIGDSARLFDGDIWAPLFSYGILHVEL